METTKLALIVLAAVLAVVPLARAAACDCPAAPESAKVCGSNGNTYASECHLNCAKAAMNATEARKFKMEHAGECPYYDIFEDCTIDCKLKSVGCALVCIAPTIHYPCFLTCSNDHLTDCYCKKEYSNVECFAEKAAAAAGRPKGAPVLPAALAPAPKDVRDGVLSRAQCRNDRLFEISKCAAKCTTKECSNKCAQDALDEVCKCAKPVPAQKP